MAEDSEYDFRQTGGAMSWRKYESELTLGLVTLLIVLYTIYEVNSD